MKTQYFLKIKKKYSDITDEEIREIFEKRMKDIYMESRVNLKRLPRSGYEDENIQSKWEEFFNGFRLGEDRG